MDECNGDCFKFITGNLNISWQAVEQHGLSQPVTTVKSFDSQPCTAEDIGEE